MNEDRASRYHRLRRTADLASALLGGAFLLALAGSGAAVALRAWVEHVLSVAGLAGTRGWLVLIAAYVALVALATELLTLPLAWYRSYALDRTYGLSHEGLGAWALDHLKALGVSLVVGIAAIEVAYVLLAAFPAWWWVPAGALFALLAVGLAFLAPVVLLPLFYRFEPLEREPLRDRLVALAARAGTPIVGAYTWKLGEKSRTANAALVGIGATRRILVSDTLLDEYSDDEIEVVLAHELAHHVHRDLWTSIALDVLLLWSALAAAHVVLRASWGALGLRSPADVAGFPVLVLTVAGWSMLATPVANALSRTHERRADRFALELTGNAGAFIAAMKRLSAQNLADERPSRLVEILFHSHPPIPQRIAAAREWQVGQ
jgi:STE24 endopeptidase